jgi:AdoMet-dependent rRNA methyltransferase SPB1
LLKIQLNMTAPEDLDNDDRALGGEDDMFDLGEGEREMARSGRKKGKGLGEAVNDADGMSDDEEEEVSSDEEEELYDSEEEREAKVKGLEGELDHLYDEYKERMSERDAKYKVKMARMKDRNFDAWHGIKDGDGSGDEDGVDKGYRDGMVRAPARGAADEDEGEESEEGGWDVVANKKATMGEDADISDDSEDEEDSGESKTGKPKKNVRIARPTVSKIKTNAGPSRPAAATTLVTSLQEGEKRAQMSRQAQLWFDQPVFKGLSDLAALDGEDEDEEETGSEDAASDDEEDIGSLDDGGDVEMEDASGASSTLDDEELEEEVEDEDDDDFEIVPREKDDGDLWDVDDEDQDEVKKKYVQGMFSPSKPLNHH